jgi:hypothetical protein
MNCQPELVEGGLHSEGRIGFDELSLTSFKLAYYQKLLKAPGMFVCA